MENMKKKQPYSRTLIWWRECQIKLSYYVMIVLSWYSEYNACTRCKEVKVQLIDKQTNTKVHNLQLHYMIHSVPVLGITKDRCPKRNQMIKANSRFSELLDRMRLQLGYWKEHTCDWVPLLYIKVFDIT